MSQIVTKTKGFHFSDEIYNMLRKHKSKQLLSYLLILSLLCGSFFTFNVEKATAAVKTIKVSKTSIKLVEKKTYTLKATKAKKFKSYKTRWMSYDSKIAKVSSTGKVTAVKYGVTYVKAYLSNGKYSKCKITVSPIMNTNKNKISLNKASYSLRNDKIYTLSAITALLPTSSSVRYKPTFSSDDKKIVTINSKGKLTPKSKGTTYVRAKISTKDYAVCKVTVFYRVTTHSIYFKATPSSLLASTLKAVTVSVVKKAKSSKSGTPNETVKWASSNTNVATVSSSGKITPKVAGYTTISATAESGKKVQKRIRVNSLYSATKEISLFSGWNKTVSLSHYSIPSSTTKTVSISKPTDIALAYAINSSLYITAKAVGTTTIKAQVPDGSYVSIKLTIKYNPVVADISYWNKSALDSDAEWDKFSKGVGYPILRALDASLSAYPASGWGNGDYGGYTTVSRDSSYPIFAAQCKKRGIPFGTYMYNRYTSNLSATKEADRFFKAATQGNYRPTVFFLDIEDIVMKNKGASIRTYTRTFIKHLREIAVESGFYSGRLKVGVYVGNHLYTAVNLDLERDTADSATPDISWIPAYSAYNVNNYTAKMYTSNVSYYNSTIGNKICDMWQYTSNGKIDGVSGRYDLNTLVTKTYSSTLKKFTRDNKISKKSWFSFSWFTTK